MKYDWNDSPSNIRDFVFNLISKIKQIIDGNYIGFYLHGSLAMGGFNPDRSDLDVIVATNEQISIENKRKLAKLFISYSNNPFPIEISFLNKEQLDNWKHPSLFDFHFSEYWRERYEKDLSKGQWSYINEYIGTDPDLAAHLYILNYRGICIDGRPIAEIFPTISQTDYISSIKGDYRECLVNLEDDPIYCSLNMLRVFMYIKSGIVASKQEAGEWGISTLPEELSSTIQKVLVGYRSEETSYNFDSEELLTFKNYIHRNLEELLEV
ncbi:aminoglycoside adenylyltransferase domain-containing protein [Pseudalkalibacillus sp. SCS-8]|uniref:aminoglycoside adenylyltransferase domain-containing protein n=1 Tax=Pseudalkalibacillus nanhaiensis TaxID=3115291 RepID=UPI0032DADE5F